VLLQSRAEGPNGYLEVSGEVDLAVADELHEAAMGVLDDADVTTLRVDMTGVTFLDSSGLGALVRARRDAAERGVSVVLVNPTSTVRKVLTITGLDDAFEVEVQPDERDG
jgi:anti-anti-sigma factor